MAVLHVPFELLNHAGLVGGRLSWGCRQGFQREHHDEAKQESRTLLSEPLEKY